jgi:protein TonB
MALRCLLFSTNEEMVQPIWQVLVELGIEGEYCKSAVDAVERVTTQLFQIVITDWEDQPEAAFLLKTARDLKAATRPLTLAIVGDNARLPEALQAGANSVLVKPIRAEQVRDTMSTACELLRAKQQPAATQAPATPSEPTETGALALAAAAGAASSPVSVSVPNCVIQAPEKTFRAGEFLQSPGSEPGGQFDTEQSEVQKSLDQAAAAEVDALTELEPTASAVQDAPAEPTAASKPQEAMTGWAALQARLTKAAPPASADSATGNEMLAYGDTPSYGSAAPGAETSAGSGKKEWTPKVASETSASEIGLEEGEGFEEPAPEPRSKGNRIVLAGALAVACVVLVAVPRTRQSLRVLSRNAVHAGQNWLNPPPAPLPQAVPVHDSFGQSGDEYKLPVVGNIPDATTDPSQIRVLPVVDPTAKPQKGAEANSAQAPTMNEAQVTTGENSAADQNQTPPGQSGQPQVGEAQVKDSTSPSAGDMPATPVEAAPAPVPPPVQSQVSAPVATSPPAHAVTPPVQRPAAPRVVSAATSVGIPSSLKSQMASSTPEASGNKPAEAATSSIEPVKLPESAARELLSQPVDPEYPAAAKASGQRGSVVLQVTIGRDGAVQDAKFLQGSLMFARPAIDAVRQWHFKPYSMNGHPVSVQSVITLNFKPPA